MGIARAQPVKLCRKENDIETTTSKPGFGRREAYERVVFILTIVRLPAKSLPCKDCHFIIPRCADRFDSVRHSVRHIEIEKSAEFDEKP